MNLFRFYDRVRIGIFMFYIVFSGLGENIDLEFRFLLREDNNFVSFMFGMKNYILFNFEEMLYYKNSLYDLNMNRF